jgi:hypothetical protein
MLGVRAVAPPGSTLMGRSRRRKHKLKRKVKVGVLAIVAVSTVFSETPTAGWKMRVDRSATASEPGASGLIKILTEGSGFQAAKLRDVVYWNPVQTMTIDLSAEMSVMKTAEKHSRGATGIHEHASDRPDAWIRGQGGPKPGLEVRSAMPA